MKKNSLVILCCLISLFPTFVLSQNVWTQHNDQGRTGWYPYETTLNTTNVSQNTFGFNFSHLTDDKIIGQPLVILNVNIPNKGLKNVVFVTTVNNSVYAFDADVNADAYWQQNYSNKIAAAPAPDCSNCRPANAGEIHPDLCIGSYSDFSGMNTPVDMLGNMGIIGAPVIDTLAGTMYFVTKIVNPNDPGYDNHNWVPTSIVPYEEYTYPPNGFHQYLHAIDITTGAERSNSPIEINPSLPGTGDGQTSPGIISFNPRSQFNRAGLALANGNVYIAFAAHCDNNPSHGWLISYNASSLAFVHAFISTPNDGRGGIWMSGTAPAVDESGNLYVTTGNSLNEDPNVGRNKNRIHIYQSSLASDPANRGEGVIKLAPDLTLSSYFTPYNYVALNDGDADFPIQVMLLPNTNLAMTGCKDGNFYIMDKTNLGGFDTHSNLNRQTFYNGGSMHSSFAYFGGPTPYAYQLSEATQLYAYPVTSAGLLNGSVIKNTVIIGPSGGTGGFLSVSSNGTDPSTGILWANHAQNGCNANNGNCHAIFHALDASDITKELWNSDMAAADQVTVFNKFSCPTIALGKVFIAANKNQLYCYGIKTNTSCVTNVALNKTVTVSSASASAANTVDGNLGTSWTAVNQDAEYIYIDLGSEYDICRMAIYWFTDRYAKDFDMEISDDAVTWTVAKSIRGNSADYSEFNNVVTARYVRMEGITRNGSNAYAIDEFQLFGSLASTCRAPSSLTAASLTPHSEHISWDPVSGANQYIVKYHHNLSPEWLVKTVNTNALDLTALSCGSLYYYSVQANCSGVPGALSQGSFTPTGCAQNTCDIFPVRYYHLDVGDIGVAGSTCKNGNVYTLTGSGTDIGGTSDQFQFAYTNNNNSDFEALGQLIQQDQVFPSNKLGIMVRDSITSTSRFAFIASVNNGSNFIFEYRDVAGGPVYISSLPGTYSLPVWLKVVKTGTNYTGYISGDNISWSQLGASVDLHFGNDPANLPNYGMAVTSANNAGLSSGQIQGFTFEPSNSNPLPVRLLNFTAKAVNHDHVLVSWATSMEHLADYFLVQRSLDNKGFQTVDKVNAVGESETEQHYSIHDNKPGIGTNYYRLKEVDKDGKFYFSPVVSVKFEAPAGFEIYPNPAADFTNINSLRDPITDVKLFDITGKLLQNIHLEGSQLTVNLNLSGLSKGIYFVSVKTTTTMYRQKLFRQ